MSENIMTQVQEKMYKMYSRMDKIIANDYIGDMPYGMKKATAKEQRERFENLTPRELPALIKKHGFEEVNEYLRKNTEGY